jgi:RNA polymerase sigma-70 factor (ECF subfamily)
MSKTQLADDFVDLYSRYARRIYAFIRTLVPHHADAEDVAQEVGRVLWEKFNTYEPGTDFLSWAFQIAHFKVLQHRRSKARSPAVLADAVVELIDHEVLNSAANQDARQSALAECMQKLPLSDRQLIEARYKPGETTQSVANSLGRSIDAVYRALRRIHKALFECVRRNLAEESQA